MGDKLLDLFIKKEMGGLSSVYFKKKKVCLSFFIFHG
jgi:hypothetical protein